MSSTLVISLIALIVVISLVASAISYSRQQAMKKRKLSISKLKQQADELLGYISLLLKIDESYDLLVEIQSLAVRALKSAYILAPDDQLISTNFHTQEGKLLNFQHGQRNNPVTCYVSSDIELNQALSQIGQISKLLDIYRNKGSLTAAKCQEMQEHLQTLKTELNVNSHLYQADHFGEVRDMTMYQMHIKQAIETLKRNGSDSKEKNDRIRELSSILTEAKRTNKVVGDKNMVKPMNPNQASENSNRKAPQDTDEALND